VRAHIETYEYTKRFAFFFFDRLNVNVYLGINCDENVSLSLLTNGMNCLVNNGLEFLLKLYTVTIATRIVMCVLQTV